MHKKAREYDKNIIKALQNLKVPLRTFDNHNVFFNEDKRKETIFEHIANKEHHLHLVDIQLIPVILMDRTCLKIDRKGNKNRLYIGKRIKNNERLKYLKIVTKLSKDRTETVITIYPIKNVDS